MKKLNFFGIKVLVCDTYDELSREATKIVAGAIKKKPAFVLGLATGTSPLGLYKGLAEANKKGEIDFSEVRTFNLDEYYPIDPKNDQSYRYFMNKNLFNKINVKKKNTRVPDGQAEDIKSFCESYEEDIKAAGGIDLQVLGIGRNGHIGFNEPCDRFYDKTHVVTLTKNTIDANSRFFASADLVPKKAITMGVGTIMRAKKIVMVVNGENKADAVKGMLTGDCTPKNQASILRFHKDVTVILDKEAASKIL